ncbi:MAG: 3',5'-cyclic-nucleotide phosphodiesterase [Planctomycetes bacterium]|nr:3',5'-cyclic-nucleotide phosphodiesterase [Planctomycetota bacterium]
MKIKVIGSSVDGNPCQYAASYVINDHLAIDAGSIGFMSVAAQKQIQHILISHSHLDHIGSLPIFIDNVYAPGPDCVKVYGSESVVDCLKSNFFNDCVWPDLLRLSREESPFLDFVTLENAATIQLGDIKVTPIALDHVIPTFGFVIDDGESAMAVVSDTGPTEKVWEVANQNEHLKCVIIEAAFPNSMAWLAERAKHLTPELMHREYDKLDRQVPLMVVHIKPAYYEEVTTELRALRLPLLEISAPNCEYEI